MDIVPTLVQVAPHLADFLVCLFVLCYLLMRQDRLLMKVAEGLLRIEAAIREEALLEKLRREENDAVRNWRHQTAGRVP